jgi:ABC-type sugar transport system ATPase subunit
VAAIGLRDVGKTFANGQVAVRGVTIDIADGELLVLVGPSGSGKSTVLRLIAGLEAPTTGAIGIGGRDVTTVAPQQRDLAMVFQSYALYPHKSVRDNLAFGLRVRRVPAAEVDARVRRTAAALGIEPLLDRRPAQLSGGQRQRVALGRAIVREPQAFLLDEPLSNLDPQTRAGIRTELALLHQRLGATMIYVTHDQEEAMTLGSRVAVMHDGRIEQVAPPLELYAEPVNTFVAQFIGQPRMNLLEAPASGIDTPPGTLVGIRPHDVVVGRDGPLRAIVDVVEPRGHDAILHLRLQSPGAPPLVAIASGALPPPGTEVGVTLPAGNLHVFDADGRRRSGRAVP